MLTSYITEYEKNFDEQASTFGGHAYDAYIVLKAAIEEAGTDRAALRDAIEGISGLAGTGGVFTFSADDHNGLDIDSFEMITVKAGKFVPLAQ